MNLFNIQRISDCLSKLRIAASQCGEAKEDHTEAIYIDSYIDGVRDSAEELRLAFIDNEWSESAAAIQDASVRIKHGMNVSALLEVIDRIESAATRQLSSIKVVNVKNDRTVYLDNEALFVAIKGAFPSAISELVDSANCLALECCTASVFHAMCAAEIALRALARDRRVEVPKRRTIEFATWETIIKELEKAETNIMNYPQTSARQSQFDFYHGAMMEFRAFKNKFRNNVMHTRDRYDREEAKSALTHVVDFMRILSGRIGESRRTPMIWKRI